MLNNKSETTELCRMRGAECNHMQERRLVRIPLAATMRRWGRGKMGSVMPEQASGQPALVLRALSHSGRVAVVGSRVTSAEQGNVNPRSPVRCGDSKQAPLSFLRVDGVQGGEEGTT